VNDVTTKPNGRLPPTTIKWSLENTGTIQVDYPKIVGMDYCFLSNKDRPADQGGGRWEAPR
jgi:hypothetical protein